MTKMTPPIRSTETGVDPSTLAVWRQLDAEHDEKVRRLLKQIEDGSFTEKDFLSADDLERIMGTDGVSGAPK